MFCRVRNKIMYVLSWLTVSALTRVLFRYLFPLSLRNLGNKHQRERWNSSSPECIYYSICNYTRHKCLSSKLVSTHNTRGKYCYVLIGKRIWVSVSSCRLLDRCADENIKSGLFMQCDSLAVSPGFTKMNSFVRRLGLDISGKHSLA